MTMTSRFGMTALAGWSEEWRSPYWPYRPAVWTAGRYTGLPGGATSRNLAGHRSMSTVFVISAPSGTGKSTLVSRLVARDRRLSFAISVTTRQPRAAEVDGEAYQFVTEDCFREMRDRGEFLEWAEVFGHLYGTPWSAVEEARSRGTDLLLDIDVQGAASLRQKLPGASLVFILPPSSEVLAQRLRDRSSDDREVIERRLGEASREVRSYRFYDYVVVNDDIDRSVERLSEIVRAERSKRENMESTVEPILRSFAVHEDATGEKNG